MVWCAPTYVCPPGRISARCYADGPARAPRVRGKVPLIFFVYMANFSFGLFQVAKLLYELFFLLSILSHSLV